MTVSFTGFKNASSLKIINDEYPNSSNSMCSVTMQLTDDYSGKDLSEFKKVAARTKSCNIGSLEDNRFINVSFVRTPDSDSFIMVNGEVIEPERDTLGMFSFVGQLLKRVLNTPQEKFAVDRDYFMGEEFDNMLVPGYNMREILGDRYNEITGNVINPNIVLMQSAEVLDGLDNIMMDYLA